MKALWILLAIAFTASIVLPIDDAAAGCRPNKRGHSGGVYCSPKIK
jgi:hypothetical protein